jgi:hypothetical protein
MPRPSTLWSSNVPLPEADSTLYELLAVSAPTGVTVGETTLTATKETIDNDQEEPIEGDIVTGPLT